VKANIDMKTSCQGIFEDGLEGMAKRKMRETETDNYWQIKIAMKM